MKDNHYKTVGVVIIAFVFIATLIKYKLALGHNYILYGVLIFGIILFSSEKLASLFVKWWMRLGKFMGDINSKIILTVLFLLIVSPTAFLRRLFTKEQTKRKSSWEDVTQEKSDFKKPW
jgi:hypothetical protein